MAIEFYSKKNRLSSWLKLSKVKTAFFVVAILFLCFSGAWFIQSYFSVTKIEIQGVEGQTKVNTKDGQKIISKGDKSDLQVGDKIAVSNNSSAMIILSNGESYLLSEDEKVIFSRVEKDVKGSAFYFTDLEKGKEIVVNTNPGLVKNSAAVLSNINLLPPAKGQVLGASDYKLSETQKYEKFLSISECIEGDIEQKDYSQSLRNCLQKNNIESLSDLN